VHTLLALLENDLIPNRFPQPKVKRSQRRLNRESGFDPCLPIPADARRNALYAPAIPRGGFVIAWDLNIKTYPAPERGLAQLFIVALFDGGVEGIHVDVNDFARRRNTCASPRSGAADFLVLVSHAISKPPLCVCEA
jgi:hypothetical protein